MYFLISLVLFTAQTISADNIIDEDPVNTSEINSDATFNATDFAKVESEFDAYFANQDNKKLSMKLNDSERTLLANEIIVVAR